MNVCSVPFLLLCGLAALAFHRIRDRRIRQAFLGALNLAFVASFVPNWSSAVALAGFVLGTFVAVRIVRAHPPFWVVASIVAGCVGVFLAVKKYAFLEPVLPTSFWQHPLELVGLSYMLFKFIHVLVDESQ